MPHTAPTGFCAHLASFLSISSRIQDGYPSWVASLLSPAVSVGKCAMKLLSLSFPGHEGLCIQSPSPWPRRPIQQVTCDRIASCAA